MRGGGTSTRAASRTRTRSGRISTGVAGALLWAAARALRAPDDAAVAVRLVGKAQGLAGWLRAVPALEAAGKRPLPDPRPEAVAALAREGLADLAEARRIGVPPTARPALLAAWEAGPTLRRAARDPARVAAGTLARPEAARRGALLLRALSGRW